MRYKTLVIFLLAILPLQARAGFYVKKCRPQANTIIFPYINQTKTHSFACERTAIVRGKTTNTLSDLDYSVLSFLLAMAGLAAVAIMIAFWSTSIIGVCVAAVCVTILGLGALGSAYMSFGGTHHHHIHNEISAIKPPHRKGGWLAGIGFMLGIVESLPVLLLGGLFVSIFQIVRFAFRRKYKI